MGQKIQFLSDFFSDSEITKIIGMELEVSNAPTVRTFSGVIDYSTRFTFIDPETGMDRPILRSTLAEVRRCHQKNQTPLLNIEATAMPGVYRKAHIYYSDVRCDEATLDQIEKELRKNLLKNDGVSSHTQDGNSIESYFSEEYINYAPELEIACNAYKAIYGNPKKVHSRGTKALLTE